MKDTFRLWFNAFSHPKETFEKEKKRASLFSAIKNIFLQTSIIAIVVGGSYGLFGLFFGSLYWMIEASSFESVNYFYGIPEPLMSLGMVVFILVFIHMVGALIMTLMGLLAESFGFFLVAKILGGKGNFTTQTYLISLFGGPLIFLSIHLPSLYSGNFLFLALALSPIFMLPSSLIFPPIAFFSLLATISGCLILLLSFYSLYPLNIALKLTHKFNTIKANLSWTVPLLVVPYLILVLVGPYLTNYLISSPTLLPRSPSPLKTPSINSAVGFENIKIFEPGIGYIGDRLTFSLNHAFGNSVENVTITLNGSGCTNPSFAPNIKWKPHSTAPVTATCKKLSPGDSFSVNVTINYDLNLAGTKKHYREDGTIKGFAQEERKFD